MSIERHHTYAAQALVKLLIEDGEEPPPLAELERDFPRVVAALKLHAQHFDKHPGIAGLIETLRRMGVWTD